MLAKQAWRLIHDEQSLFYRVYKARYFPNRSFLMAELGSNPSAVWSSLLVAREVLREGSTWQIGDGNSIEDTLVWIKNKEKTFTVKTAYRVALRLKSGALAEYSSAQEHGITWRKIWKLNVPPKVRTFLWRACSNCLPTRDSLNHRKIQVEATCELCRQEPETVAHSLWKCPFTRNVWALGSGRVHKCSNEVVDFFLFFKHM
uniref:Reverse transcriptase zinc-binding domain-containing protein n=1 Tax=Quercus lobata TaxID=97700 RepID=A0A7N2LQW7_QUELO